MSLFAGNFVSEIFRSKTLFLGLNQPMERYFSRVAYFPTIFYNMKEPNDQSRNQSGILYRTGQVQDKYKCYFFKYFFQIQDRFCTNVCIPVQRLYTDQKYQCCTGVNFGSKFAFFGRKIDVV